MNNKTKTTKKTDNRARNFVFVLYPQDCYSSWKTILNEKNIDYICSPLHDKDLNADGTPKKPHYHIILYYEGNKSYKQIFTTLSLLGEVEGITPEEMESLKKSSKLKNYKYADEFISISKKIRGIANFFEAVEKMTSQIRYLVHADNPEKFQYSKSDIEVRGAYDIAPAFKRGEFQIDSLIAEIMDFCDLKNIKYYKQFMRYARREHFEDWFNVLLHNYGLNATVQKYIQSNKEMIEDSTKEQNTQSEIQCQNILSDTIY